MTPQRPFRAWMPLVVAAMVTSCAGETGPPAKDAVVSGPPTSTLRIGLTEWEINLPKNSARPGELTLTVTNTGSVTHDLAVSQTGTRLAKTRMLAPGERTQLRVTDVQANSPRLICTVGGHEEAGMTTQLAVKT